MQVTTSLIGVTMEQADSTLAQLLVLTDSLTKAMEQQNKEKLCSGSLGSLRAETGSLTCFSFSSYYEARSSHNTYAAATSTILVRYK